MHLPPVSTLSAAILGLALAVPIGSSAGERPENATSVVNLEAAERVVLHSEVLDEERPLNIVLPAGYSEDTAYPVVIALDGDADRIQSLASRMQAARSDLLVVGVENIDRPRDMFPDPVPARRSPGGGGRQFLAFLTSELIPHVHETYSTTGYIVLSGQSNSGFFVLFALASAPDAFDAYLASSPMIGWDWELIRTQTSGLLKERTSLPRALYLNHGETDSVRTTDFLPQYIDLIKTSAPSDFRWFFEIAEGEEHVPESSYANGMTFIFGTL